jgi:hypothetical protein
MEKWKWEERKKGECGKRGRIEERINKSESTVH